MPASKGETIPGNLVGVVVSDDMYRGDDKGYGLIIARERIIGAKKPDSMQNFQALLHGSTPDSSQLTEAKEIAGELIAASGKSFDIGVGSIGQALFAKPTLFSGGYVIFKTALRAIRVETSSLYPDLGLTETSRVLERSLWTVLGRRLCDGRTGKPLSGPD